MQPWILKQSKSLHEVLEVWCLRVVRLVHVSRCVSKIANSKLQVLKPLEHTSRTELKFLSIELPKVHIPFWLLECCFRNFLKKASAFLTFSFCTAQTCQSFFSLQNMKNSLSGIWRRIFIDTLVTPFAHFHLV